ncbi:MAG: hypothetical protein ABIJ34_02005 [archaeon]
MKRGMVFFVILFLPFIMASETKIYEGWATSGEYFNVSGETYRAVHMIDQNLTVVNLPNGKTTVVYMYNSSCNTQWIYKVCETAQRYEKNGIPVPTNIHAGSIDTFVFLVITKEDVDLVMTKTLSDASFYTDASYTVNLTISTIGDEEISNITLKDIYPKSFRVEKISGCELSENIVSWRGNLRKSKQTCIFKVTPIIEGIYSNNASVKFISVGQESQKIIPATIDVADMPLIFETKHTDGPIRTGDFLSVNFSLHAKRDVMIDSFDVSIPDSHEIQNLSVFPGKLSVKITLPKDNITLLSFTSRNVLEGAYGFNVSISYRDKNAVKTISQKYPITYYGNSLNVSIYDKGELTFIRLGNSNNESFRDIRVLLGNQIHEEQELGRRSFKDLPIIKDNSSTLFVSYRTQYGQIITKEYPFGKNLYIDTPSDAQTEKIVTPSQAPQQSIIDYQKLATYVLPVTVGGFIILLIIVFGIKKSINSKTKLDKEIEEIKANANPSSRRRRKGE